MCLSALNQSSVVDKAENRKQTKINQFSYFCIFLISMISVSALGICSVRTLTFYILGDFQDWE